MLSIKSVADLDLLEAEILEEEKNLQNLKDSLDKAETLTNRMIKTLDDFDEKISELDPVIMPIFRAVQGMSLVQGNVENTLGMLRLIESYNKLADEEEDALTRGVSLENVGEFIGSLNKMSEALNDLQKKRLDFCPNTVQRLTTLTQTGLSKLLGVFQDWLQEYSPIVDPKLFLDQTERPMIPETVSVGLKLISGFAFANEDQSVYSDLTRIYIQTRSAILKKSLSLALEDLKESLGEVQGTYQKGSHPYLRTLSLVALMMEEEGRFALQCLPSSDPVTAVLKGVATEWFTITQLICSIVQRSLDKRAFADQIFIFDLISTFARLLQESKSRGSNNVLDLLHNSLGALASLGGTFLARLRQETEQEARQSSTLPTPTNATVFEQTSSLLNCMRRMVEYNGVIEGLLERLEQTEGPIVINHETVQALSVPEREMLPLMATYYQQGLKWLEAAIEVRAKTYRKPVQGLVFRLNNYRYIQRVLSSSYIGALVPIESEHHYQEVLQQLRDQYMTSWKAITRILDANEPLTGSMGMGMATSKDRAKVFMNEIAEAVKIQSVLAIPDPEFRITIKEQVKKTVLEPFEEFYNQNPTVFLSMAAKGPRFDKEVLGDDLSKILSG